MFTVLQISDAHLAPRAGQTVYGADPQERLRLVLADCQRRVGHPNLIALTGDQADGGLAEPLQRLTSMLRPLHVPVLAVPGNHDDPAAHRAVFGEPGVAELGDWRVVGVDTSVPGEIHGSVDVRALERRLDEIGQHPTVVAMHHPPVAPTAHPWFRLEHAPRLLCALASRRNIRAVTSGHVHTAFEREHEGLALLGAPSTLASFGHHDQGVSVGEGGPTGARVLRLLDDGSLTSEVIEA